MNSFDLLCLVAVLAFGFYLYKQPRTIVEPYKKLSEITYHPPKVDKYQLHNYKSITQERLDKQQAQTYGSIYKHNDGVFGGFPVYHILGNNY